MTSNDDRRRREAEWSREESGGTIYKQHVEWTAGGEKKSELRHIAEFKFDDFFGRRRKLKDTKSSTKRQAEKALIALRKRAHEAKFAPPQPKAAQDRTTVGEWFDLWHEARLQGRYTKNGDPIRPSTAQKERRYVATLKGIRELGQCDLRTLTPEIIEGVTEDLMTLYIGKARTLKFLFDTLRQALGDVRPRFERDLFSLVDAPTYARKEATPIDVDELHRLLRVLDEPMRGDSVTDQVFAAVIHTLAATGMRIGEVLGLHVADLDLDAGVIHVRSSLGEIVGRGLLRGPTKNGKSRKIPVTSDLVARLRRLRRSNPTLPFVFANDHGEPIRSSSLLTRKLHPLLDDLEMKRFGFHRFRHTWASIVLHRGVDIGTVSNMLGHSSLAITLSVYGHYMPGRQNEAVEAIGAALAAGAGSRS